MNTKTKSKISELVRAGMHVDQIIRHVGGYDPGVLISDIWDEVIHARTAYAQAARQQGVQFPRGVN